MNPRLTLPAALLATAALVVGCGGGDANSGSTATINIVASTNVWGDVAAQVGGGDVKVTSILTNPEQDPHSFEANPRTTLALSKADLLIENGGGYDDYMDTLRKAQNENAPVLNAVSISGKAAQSGGDLNEHVWYDLQTVQKVADKIAEALAAKDTQHAADYRSRANAFNDKVAALIAREGEITKTAAGKSIGITEPVPLYMTGAVGLINATPPAFSAAVEEGEDIAPRVLSQTLQLYSDKRIAALVYNKQTSGPVTEQVKRAATDAGIPVVAVTETVPPGQDYLSWMSDNLEAIANAVGAR